MLLSRKYKFIFIHIYKSAGTSITNALLPFAATKLQRVANPVLRKFNIAALDARPCAKHASAPEIIRAMGREAFESYFSFAIIRNPWDWQVSLYMYMLKDTNHFQHDLIKRLGKFDEYIRWRCAHEVRFQKDYIYSDDGELLVNFVGRFENLKYDFQIICQRIGVKASLPKQNVSNRKPYRRYYTNETRDMVRHAFDPDISLFGYDF